MKHLIKIVIYKLFSRYLVRLGNPEQIYITFDDGPHPINTLKILDVLGKYNVKATFFMLGSEMEKFPDIVKNVINQGHSIGYHSYYHSSMKELTINSIFKDLNYADKLNSQFNYKIKILRPPYGDLTISGLVWIMVNNWKIIMWSKDSRDSFDSKEKVIKNILAEKITPGEILLFHDDYDDTPFIIDTVLTNFSENNIKFGVF